MLIPKKRAPKPPRTTGVGRFHPDQRLMHFNRHDSLLFQDVLGGGCLVLGKAGGGKSSGVVPAVADSWLSAGGNCVFLTVKPADADMWQAFAEQCGAKSITCFSLADRFNPLREELVRSGDVAGQAQRLLEIALTPLRRRQQHSTSSDGGYFEAEGERAVAYVLTILRLAPGFNLSFRTLYEALVQLPTSLREAQSESWRHRNRLYQALLAADRSPLSAVDRADLEDAARYLLEEVPRMPSRTRASVVTTVTSAIFPLVHAAVGHCLNGESDTWSPRYITECSGAALVLDCPIQTYGPAAAVLQRLCLTAIENAVLQRTMTPDSAPVLLVLDEGHNVLDPDVDVPFSTSARDRRGALLVSTQTVGQIRSCCSRSRDPQAAGDALVGMMSSRIFCNTSDPATLELISRTFAETLQTKVSMTEGEAQRDKHNRGRSTGSTSFQREYAADVRAIDVARLRTGGRQNNHVVQAYISNGRLWSNGRPSILVNFPQYRLNAVR